MGAGANELGRKLNVAAARLMGIQRAAAGAIRASGRGCDPSFLRTGAGNEGAVVNLAEEMRAIARRHSDCAPPRPLGEHRPSAKRDPFSRYVVPDEAFRGDSEGSAVPEKSSTRARVLENGLVGQPALRPVHFSADALLCESRLNTDGWDAHTTLDTHAALDIRATLDGPEADEPLQTLRHDFSSERRTLKPDRSSLSTGWSPIDELLGGGLARGALHEWFGVTTVDGTVRGEPWMPPLTVLTHLAWRGLETCEAARWIVWVGRACFPYPRALLRGQMCDQRLLTRSIFVAPPDAYGRLWAIDLALRCPAVEGVLADGSEFDRVATQRVQFLARTRNKWAILTRPVRELDKLSAAHSRWRVQWAQPRGMEINVQPRWSVELLRCKGLAGDSWRWELESDHAQGGVRVSAALVDSAGSAARDGRRVAGGGVAG